MMKPGFNWSTGKADNNSQSNSPTFQKCELRAPIGNIGDVIGTIECR